MNTIIQEGDGKELSKAVSCAPSVLVTAPVSLYLLTGVIELVQDHKASKGKNRFLTQAQLTLLKSGLSILPACFAQGGFILLRSEAPSFPEPDAAQCLKSLLYLKFTNKMCVLPHQRTQESVSFIMLSRGYCCYRLELGPMLLTRFLFLSLAAFSIYILKVIESLLTLHPNICFSNYLSHSRFSLCGAFSVRSTLADNFPCVRCDPLQVLVSLTLFYSSPFPKTV